MLDETSNNTHRRMPDDQDPTSAIRCFLLESYGPMVNTEGLVKVLNFKNRAALDRSVQRGHVDIKLVRIKDRRGYFALTSDLADYLVKLSGGGILSASRKERAAER